MCTINKTEGLSSQTYISCCVILDSLKAVTILDHFHVQQDCTSAVRGPAGDTAWHPLWEHMAEEQIMTGGWGCSHSFFLEKKNTEANTRCTPALFLFSYVPSCWLLLRWGMSEHNTFDSWDILQRLCYKHGYKVNKLTSKILKLYWNGNEYDIQYHMITRAEQSDLSRSYCFYV